MAKYNWEALKQEYLLNDNLNLKDFAAIKDIRYDVLRRRAVGWNDEKAALKAYKSHKIIEEVTAREVKHEVNRASLILAAGDVILEKLHETISSIVTTDSKAASLLNTAAMALERVQKVQHDQRRISLEERKYSLNRQRLTGVFNINPDTLEIDDTWIDEDIGVEIF